jgi:hypothetical protein
MVHLMCNLMVHLMCNLMVQPKVQAPVALLAQKKVHNIVTLAQLPFAQRK